MSDNRPPHQRKKKTLAIAVMLAGLVCVPVFNLSAGTSLVMGIVIGLTAGNPFPSQSRFVTKYLLQLAIVGLGFGMNIHKVVEAGKDGFVFTVLTLSLAMGLGYLLGRVFKTEKIISYLISTGTAICGGSAIAAISQVVEADEKEISVSIGTVFILNAVALLIFPPIGTYIGLSQQQFGVWAAIAIHDTSSVVGAAAHYGNEALMTATTVKLARALWIIPLVLITSFIFRKQSHASSFPWFILLFIMASVASTYFRLPEDAGSLIVKISKTTFSITLFLIGTGISLSTIRSVGARPLLQGVVLWLVVLSVSLFFVCS
ncbi:MAG: putative sulfate exporter family transporter [Bacteroidia bacterium]|nr:putative sulfate exporter family transporter [Bacteroidia bacterium]